MKCDLGHEFVEGMEVIVSGEQDAGTFNCNHGVVVSVDDRDVGAYGPRTLIRFSDWNGGHGVDKNQWYFFESDRASWTITSHGIAAPAPVGPSTYLNGLEDSITFEPRYEWSEDPVARAVPLFSIAWLEDDGQLYQVDNDTFGSQREADEAANSIVSNHPDSTLVVLKAVSKHTSRIVVSTEAA